MLVKSLHNGCYRVMHEKCMNGAITCNTGFLSNVPNDFFLSKPEMTMHFTFISRFKMSIMVDQLPRKHIGI